MLLYRMTVISAFLSYKYTIWYKVFNKHKTLLISKDHKRILYICAIAQVYTQIKINVVLKSKILADELQKC